MGITVYPITPSFVAEVGDIDLSKPLPREDEQAVKAAFWKYAVLIFPEQNLEPDQQAAFSELFGPIETDRVLSQTTSGGRVDSRFSDISNLNREGRIWEEDSRQRMYKLGNKLWHTDSSFKRRPGLCSLLWSRTVVPLGGHTEFADQRAAYDALPEAMKRRLTGLVAMHSIETSRRRTGFSDFAADEAKRLPPVPQTMVRTIPESGRKSLYIASHAGSILGMPDAEANALLEELMAHITQRQFVYTHRWRPHDLVMWDNRCTLHRGTDFDDMRWVRDMRRTTVSDIANTCEQEGIAIPA